MYNFCMVDVAFNDDNLIPLDVAKELIISILKDFDPILGHHARNILLDDTRLTITEELVPRTGIMACRPAGITIQDLKDREMYIEDYDTRFGPEFDRQDNENGTVALIDFEYTYTVDSVSYLAHELGHAIADDIQRACGLSFRDFTPSALEEQAYFIQSIVASRIDPQFNKLSGPAEHDESGGLTRAFNRHTQRLTALHSFAHAQTLESSQRSRFITETLGGQSLPPVNSQNDHPALHV